MFALIWLGVELVLASISGRPYDHYFIMLLPPMALLTAALISEILAHTHAPANLGRRVRSPAMMASLFALVMLRPLLGALVLRARTGGIVPARASSQVVQTADYVRAHSSPADRLLVWGLSGGVYFLAQRPAASKYLFAFPLLTRTYGDSVAPDFLAELRHAPPALIVDAAVSDQSAPPLSRWRCGVALSAAGLVRALSHDDAVAGAVLRIRCAELYARGRHRSGALDGVSRERADGGAMIRVERKGAMQTPMLAVPPRTVSDNAAVLVSDQHRTSRAALLAALVIGALVRGWHVWEVDFPLNNGGLFYAMVRDIQRAHYHLPAFTSYNGAHIPFGYSPLGFYLAGVLNDRGVDLLTLFAFCRSPRAPRAFWRSICSRAKCCNRGPRSLPR